jgi:phosphoglycolate phosphatase-like HAD superfamily hydrolase
MTVYAIDLDAIGDTRSLWEAWLADAATVLDLGSEQLPADRGLAAETLDRAGAGNWRVLLERFASDNAPVHLRPAAEVSATIRRLAAAGARLGVYTDAPRELADVALAHLGAARRTAAVEAGVGALARLTETLGGGSVVVRTRDELLALP